MASDSSQSALDRVLVEAGYPADELDELLEYAQGKFDRGLDNHPEGDNWSGANPRDLANGVDQNARSAVLKAERGEFHLARRELGDSLNYLLFAWAVLNRMEDEYNGN